MSLKVVCLLGLGFLSVVAGLDRCFTGDGTAKSGWTKDPCASGWCLTLGGSDDVQDHRECDTSGVCEAYGAKCGPPVVVINNQTTRFPGGELCCCRGDLCNASAPHSLTLITLFCGFICVFLSKYQ